MMSKLVGRPDRLSSQQSRQESLLPADNQYRDNELENGIIISTQPLENGIIQRELLPAAPGNAFHPLNG